MLSVSNMRDGYYVGCLSDKDDFWAEATARASR
jgi:hypothetical protein